MSRKSAACIALAAFALAPFAFAAPSGGLTLTSTEVANGKTIAAEQILNGFGCSGANVSPGLKWTEPPAGTKSFALTVYDPDAPTGSGWWHWVVVDIPAAAREIPKGAGKSGTVRIAGGARQTRTDFGTPGYGGPCPPQGDKPHRYVFTVTALDIDKLPVPDDASGALVGFNVGAHALGKSTMTATYGR
ncbi:MAG TPA: YbhB/YbcL family Raf kinase inhibitor-like protein [Micropepsaceae bacterium]|nr:YbhB/YbcL family Raf kinase inhibitor-like protein [Micropepsaceae bacterium]